MLAVIAASAFELRDTIGKSAFDERVMTAMGNVPRHEFVPIEYQPYAYANIPLPIGFEKTISQPFIVALMTDLLDIKADDSVLEIGTGLGYQTAILAQLATRYTPSKSSKSLAKRRNNDSDSRAAAMSNSRLPMAITVGQSTPPLTR